MDLFNIKMFHTKKSELYTSFPLIVIALIVIAIAIVMLHIMVVMDSSDGRETQSSQDFQIDTSYFIKDFLSTPLNISQKQQYQAILSNLNFNVGETIQLKEILARDIDKNLYPLESKMFKAMREDYLEENEEILKKYFEFYNKDFSSSEFLGYGYFKIEKLNQGGNCRLENFNSPDYKVMPVKSDAIIQEIFIVSFFGFNNLCENEMISTNSRRFVP